MLKKWLRWYVNLEATLESHHVSQRAIVETNVKVLGGQAARSLKQASLYFVWDFFGEGNKCHNSGPLKQSQDPELRKEYTIESTFIKAGVTLHQNKRTVFSWVQGSLLTQSPILQMWARISQCLGHYLVSVSNGSCLNQR